MFKLMIVGGVSLLLLAGCDDKTKVRVGISGASNESGSEQKIKSTTIHLPGGAGIDFRREPIRDVFRETEKGNKYRVVDYEFDEAFDVVSSSVDTILRSEGYSREEQVDAKYSLSVMYRKQGTNPVLFRYGSTKRPQGNKTALMLWWYL